MTIYPVTSIILLGKKKNNQQKKTKMKIQYENRKKNKNHFFGRLLKINLFLFLFCCSTLMANVVNVSDYGAIANDGVNDTDAIKNALNACDRNGAVLNFTSGTYLVDGDVNGTIFVIWGYNNLSINGNGALLSCKNKAIVFYGNSCSQVRITDFSIDWDRDLPFSYGWISNKGSGYIDVTLHAPQVARAGLNTEAILEYDTANMRPKENGFDVYQIGSGLGLTQIISPNVMRCFTNSSLAYGRKRRCRFYFVTCFVF